MPQPGQIIPSYLHSHSETFINDNTEFQEQVATPVNGVRGIYVFTSPKGRDRVLLEKTDHLAFIEEYGNPNFKLYGQPAYMPYNALQTGVVEAQCMRVTPDDATYSNLVIVAKVKVDQGPVATPVPKLVVRFEAVHIPKLQDQNELAELVELMIDEDPDVNGFMTYPLFAVYSQGRGVYGDSFRVRINTAAQSDKENDFKNYRVEVYELANTLVRKEFFEVVFYPDALIGTKSIYATDVLADSDNGSQRILMHVVDESFSSIFKLYKDNVDPATTLTEETFDLLLGINKATSKPIAGLTYETTHVDFVALDIAEGIPLSGGDDGSFAATADPSVREAAMDQAYIKAFKGDFDTAILSKNRAPADLILDAGYSNEVKKQLISLMTKRQDAYGYIDAGILNTLTDALEWGEAMWGFGDRLFSKEFQHFKTRDPFTGKTIPVTITYFYASALPLHIKNVGIEIPFTGADNAKLTGAIKNTLRPVVDADDRENKEALYLLRLNYFQSVAKNTFVRGSQTTSQHIWSDLSEENNMRVTLEAKRKIETMVDGLSYKFAEKDDRRKFKEDAQRLFSNDVGKKFRSADVDFGMNPWEEERSILHAYLALVFRTIAKRELIEIDINKRV